MKQKPAYERIRYDRCDSRQEEDYPPETGKFDFRVTPQCHSQCQQQVECCVDEREDYGVHQNRVERWIREHFLIVRKSDEGGGAEQRPFEHADQQRSQERNQNERGESYKARPQIRENDQAVALPYLVCADPCSVWCAGRPNLCPRKPCRLLRDDGVRSPRGNHFRLLPNRFLNRRQHLFGCLITPISLNAVLRKQSFHLIPRGNCELRGRVSEKRLHYGSGSRRLTLCPGRLSL